MKGILKSAKPEKKRYINTLLEETLTVMVLSYAGDTQLRAEDGLILILKNWTRFRQKNLKSLKNWKKP